MLFCHHGDAQIPGRLIWTRYDSILLLEAEAASGAAPKDVYDWWQNESNGAPANNRLPYPDRLESYILERTGLPADRCERRRDEFKGSRAALTCSHPENDLMYIGYYRDVRGLRKAMGAAPRGKGTCAEPRSRYSTRRRRWVHVNREPGRRV